MRQLLTKWGLRVAPVLLLLGLGCWWYTVQQHAREIHTLTLETPDFHSFTFVNALGEKIAYRLLAPRVLAATNRYPLVVYLHGSMEDGTENIAQLKFIGPMFEQEALREQYPSYVLVTQCPPNDNWVASESYFGSVKAAAQPARPLRLTNEVIHNLLQRYRIDHDRIYLFGVSSGGSGAWDAAGRWPDLFAAVMPFAGCGDPSTAKRLARLPIWAFHGRNDVIVNPRTTRLMVAAVKAAGGDPNFTLVRSGHTCWINAFQNPKVLSWMYAQRRKPGR